MTSIPHLSGEALPPFVPNSQSMENEAVMIVRNPEDNENNREIKHILLSDLFASSGRVYHSNLRPRTIDVNDHQGNAFYPNDIYIHNIDGDSTTYILLSKTETTADWRYVGDLSCTFVIDTVDAMDKWSNNTADYDYTAVYIKSGTWTLPATRTINPTTVATKKVTGDPLSVPTINFSSQFIKSASEISNIKLNMTTPDAGLTELTAISNSENLDNVEIAWGIPDPSISVYGFSLCNKMKSCKVTGSAGSDFTAFWQCNGIDFTCESVIDYKECRFTYTKVIDPIKSVPTDNIVYTIENYGKHLVHIPKLYTVSAGGSIYTLTIKSSFPGTSVAKTLIDNNDTNTDMEFEIYVDAYGNVGKLGEDPSIVSRGEDFTLADSVPNNRIVINSTKEDGPLFITLPAGDTYYGKDYIKLFYDKPIEIIRVGDKWVNIGASINDEVVGAETTWSSDKLDKLTKEIRSSANFTLDTFTDGTRLRVINTHATNTITCTLPSGQTYNGAGTISIPAGRIIDIELIGTTWKDTLTGDLVGNADTATLATQALAIKPLGNSITLPATQTEEIKIVKIATVDWTYNGSVNIDCRGAGIEDGIKVVISGGTSITGGIRVIYGKNNVTHGIKKIIVTRTTEIWNSSRNIYAEIVTSSNNINTTTLGIVETNRGTFTPSMTEVSSVEGTVVDSLSLDYHRGDISSYQHVFTKDIIGNLTGNADTATNATNATTADKWKTARNIRISDADGTNTGSAVSVDGSENETLKLPETIKANVTGNADTANAIKPLGNSIALPAVSTPSTKIIKIGTVGVTYAGSINIACRGANIEDGIKVHINGATSITGGIRVIYGKNNTAYGIKKIIVTRTTEIWNSNRNIYAEIATSPNDSSITRLGVVETNDGTFTPSMTEVSSVEGTVIDSLSLDSYRGDISSYQHVFTKDIIGNLTGNASTSTKLATARKINGVSFDGSADITIADSTKAPTNHASTATTYGVSSGSNYGHAKASSTTPKTNGTASVGTETSTFARGDHVHPTDTTRAPLASPAFTGNPTAPTQAADNNSTRIATTAFVKDCLQPSITGSCTTNGTTDNTLALTGIVSALALEIGDVIQITGSTDGLNDKLFTVESITDDNSIIVNYEHAGNRGDGSLKLADQTASVTIKRIAKWYNASIGMGQAWVDVSEGRSHGTTYTNTTGRTIAVSIIRRTIGGTPGVNRDAYLYVDGILIAHSCATNTNMPSAQMFSTVGSLSVYSAGTTEGSFLRWAEMR